MLGLRLAAIAVSATLAVECTGAGYRAAVPAPGSPSTTTLSIIGTNDLHGGILQREDRGGLALLGGYVANVRAARARDGGGVLLVDAGDMFQGTLESNLAEGAPVVAAYNALGYVAAAVGNHEFDFGPVGPSSTPARTTDDPRGALKARAAEAAFPFLAANLVDVATGRPPVWPNVKPSTTVTAAGVQVGIVGVMTADALSVTIAANTVGLRMAPLAPTIEAEATRLRQAGATVIVVAAHAGGRCADFSDPLNLSSCAENGEIAQVARALSPGLVDAIVAGHVHQAMGHQIAGVPISEAYSGGRSFGRIDLVIDRSTKRVVERRSFAPRDLCAAVDPGTTRCDPGEPSGARRPAEYEGSPVTPRADIAAVLAPAVDAAARLKAERLGVMLETPILRRGTESALGNLFTNVYLETIGGADVAVNNTSGGLRADLPAGPLTYGSIFEVMPFDNRLVAIRLTGAEFRTALRELIGANLALPGLAGVRVRVDCQRGAADVAVSRSSGAPIRDDERLVVATTDFLATGGDRIFEPVIPPGGFSIEQDLGPVRDIVVDALRRRGGTLRADQLVDTVNPRWVLPGPLPVNCGG